MYSRRFKDLVIIAAVFLVPIQILTLVVQRSLPDLTGVDPETVELSDLAENFVGLLLLLVIVFVGILLITGAVARSVADSHVDVVTDWRESIGAAWRKLGNLAGNAILSGLGVLVGLIFCLLPGIYLWTAWVTAPVAVMLEDQGPASALGRSQSLIRGRWWPVFGALLLAFLLLFGVNLLVGLVLAAVLVSGDPNSAAAITAGFFIDLGLGILIQPFVAVVITLLYLDLRVRKEGLDLTRLAHELGADAPGGVDPVDPPWGEAPPPPGDDPS